MDNTLPKLMSIVVYSPEEVAKMYGLKVKYVKDMLRSGELPGFKIGKFWRITQASLDSFVATLIKKGNGKGHLDENVLNIIKYHANLRSKDSLPKNITKMEENILKIKGELQEQEDSDRKVPAVAKLKATVVAEEANKKKMEAMPGLLADLADNAYPGMKDLVDEDPDTLEAQFRDEALGVQEEAAPIEEPDAKSKDAIAKVPSPEMDSEE